MFINNLAYEASAGSGKTFMLVVRYLSLIFKGAEASKILALTFTNKAANEMNERIIETLEELQNRDELDEIVKVTNLSKDEILKNRLKILNSFLNSNTKIMTIDSFFTQILRKFSLYASLMPNFSTFESQHQQKLINEFLKRVKNSGKKDLLINLSLESDKRFSDIFRLLDEFYNKKEELAKFSFKSQKLYPFEQEAMDALKSLESIVDSCDGASASLKKAVSVQNFDELLSKSWIVKESLEYWVFKKCFTLDMNRYLHVIQESIKKYFLAKEQNFFYALSELVTIYIESKKALYINDSELGFSDVTSLVYEILNRIDDSEFLYFRLDANIEHMLLDEFQDTSILQYEILKPLINEITSGDGIFENGSFFFVGDVKQSIYRFRGGVSALFGVVAQENGTRIEKLLTNYRSQKEVVEFVNMVFRDKIKNYTDQLVRVGANGGYVEVLNSENLLEDVYIQVQRIIDEDADINSIAILCATNSDGEDVKNYLLENGLEVVTETTTKLINQKSVKAVLEYLKYLYFKEEIYKFNFFSLIMQNIQEISFVDFNKIELFDVIKNMINRYELFNNEFHLVRFLDTVRNYKDIEALLFEYERMDVSAAVADVNGIRVLTVHKSKGLEYENIIIMDRLKKAPSSRDSIIYDYDGISLKNVYLRTQKRAEIDTLYERAISKEHILVLEDDLNAFYVAFTRAKNNLIIIKKSEKSTFDILNLEVSSYGKLSCNKYKPKNQQKYSELEYKKLYYGTQSDLLALESGIDNDLQAINFGLALHYMLEMMGEFRDEYLDNAKHMMLNKYGFNLSNKDIIDIYTRVEMFIQDEKVKKLIDGEIYKEKGIRYKDDLRYIDLLIQKEDGSFVVIDYKSSDTFSEQHYKQVRYYVKAIKEISGQDVSGYICYLLENKIKLLEI